ncbi:MAG: outer membrane lipoprotein carrier protein LolA [Bacteroidota bacterium]
MKYLFSALLALTLTTGLWAQDYTKKGDSDPAAKKILDAVSKKYKSYKSLEAGFQLEIQLPEQPKEVQKGKMLKQGDQYRVEINNSTVFSDGEAMYVVMDATQTVQINDIPDPSETEGLSLTPEAMFNFYENGKFVYVLTNEYMDGKTRLQQIEFKPLDRGADYSKLRLEVNKKTKDVVRLMAFSKDGSRYTLSINSFAANKKYPGKLFAFKEGDYPDYYIEDLRE